MGEIERAMAKLAAIQKAVHSALHENVGRGNMPQYKRTFKQGEVAAYFQQADQNIAVLREHASEWFGDFKHIRQTPDVRLVEADVKVYSRDAVTQLERDIEQIIEIRANSEHAKPMTPAHPRRVFISHGRAKDWYEVQAHVEKDLNLGTLELAQEVSHGRTIIEKLEAESASCDSAVIVMSGDDCDAEGQARVRENVMHEIGFFQGRYGRSKVVLLHEEGVSVPTNLSGIVYVPYPKETVSGAFAVLDRELRHMYK